MSFFYQKIIMTGSCVLLLAQAPQTDAAILPPIQSLVLPTLSFTKYIAKAQESAANNQPVLSLEFYQKALVEAIKNNRPAQIRVARFGIGKMQLWLEQYQDAEATFQILHKDDLSPEDQQIALDGLVRAINYQNRPLEASKLLPEGYSISNPNLVISLAQAMLDAGLKTQAESLINTYKNLLQSIPKNSIADKQLTRLYAQIHSNKQQSVAVNRLTTQAESSVINGFFNAAAVSQTEQNKPQMALNLYKKSLAQSLLNNKPQDALAARFGIAKMQLWLEQYAAAELTWRALYQDKLSPLDQQVALDGLIRAVNYQNRPKEALALLPGHYPIANPSLAVALMQVYMSLDSPQKAQAVLDQYRSLLSAIPDKSNLEQQLDKLKNQILLATTARLQVKKPARANPHDEMIGRLVKQGEAIFNSELSDSSDPQYKQALIFYQQALSIARRYQRPDRVILFRMGAVYLSIGDFRHALRMYTQLLQQKLDRADYEVALNGYVQSLSGRDLPMKAWRSIPTDFVYQMPAMLVSASEAALWSNWPYKSMALLNTHSDLVNQIKANTHLGYRLDDLLWQSRLGTVIDTLGYSSYYEQDTDDFTIQRNTASYSHRFGVPLNTTMLLTQAHYAVPGYTSVNGTRITAQADGWLSDSLTYVANVAPATYLNWKPVLAKSGLTYAPNDFYSLTALASKDIVESVPSLLQKISLNSLNAGGVLFPAYRAKVAMGVLSDHFSDNNIREGFNLRPAILLFPDLGLYGEFYWRSYSNSIPNSPYYFSPEKYSETRVTLKLNRRANATWRCYINLGLGQQRINQDPKTPTKLMEAGLRGPIGKHFVIDAGYGYNSAAGGSATGFARQFAIVNITYLM